MAYYPYLIFFAVMVSVVIFVLWGWKIAKTPYLKYEERYLAMASGKLNKMFVFLPPETVLFLKFVSGFVFFLIVLFLSSGVPFAIVHYIVSLLGGVFGFFLPDFVLRFLQMKRKDKFDLQLMEGLSSMANSLKAGFSFPQAVAHLAKETKPPISQEFGLAIKENRLGVPIEDALGNISSRIDSEDLELMVVSIALAKEMGGNLSQIFERLAYTIRERMKLRGKINALTSQGRMQGWVVGMMPLVLGLLISFISPAMMKAFTNSLVGWLLISLIIVFEIVGGLVIKKIVTIDI